MKHLKKMLALVMAICLCIGLLPGSVAAAETTSVVDSAALTEAESYINQLTINNSSNDPATVVSNFGTHFTWDNEDRENSKSYLFDWSYYNGVVFEGLEYVYEVTGDETYKDYVVEYMSSLIDSDGTWATCSNNSSKECAGYVDYHGADCYKTASLLLDTYEMTGDERYLTMAKTLYADLDSAAETYLLSNAGNNYHHTWKSASSPNLWLDGLYMILPFRAEYAKYSGDTEELNLIVDRMQWVSDNMYDESTGYFYHAANNASSNSGTFWLRSIGWYAAAIVDVMDSMEGDNLAAMQAQLVKLADGMKATQNSSNGMWLNNLAASESSTNPYETSGTALICYAIMKAVNEGWLDESYADMAILAFEGICDEKLDNNTLIDICFKGAPGSSNSTFYDNEGKGVGPFIMLYAEVLEYQNLQSEDSGSGDDSGNVETEEPETKEVTVEGDVNTTITVTNVTGTLTADELNAEDKVLIDAQEFVDYIAFDISPTLAEGETSTISFTVPEEWTDASRIVGISIEDGELMKIPGELNGNVYSFEVDHFSAKGVAYDLEPTAEVPEDVLSGTGNLVGGKVYTLDTDGVTANKNYLIVNTSSNGTGYALTNSDGIAGRTQVTISNSTITVEDDTDIAWVFSGTASGMVKNGDDTYIQLGSNNVLGDSSELNISNQGNGAYKISLQDGRYNYYLSYSNNSWSRNSKGTNVYLYELTSSGAGTEVTFTVSPASTTLLAGKTQSLAYTITLADGTTVDSSDIEWNSGNASIVSISDEGVLTANAAGSTTITATLNSVNGTKLDSPITVTIPVTVADKVVTSVSLATSTGTVYVDSDVNTSTGVVLNVTYEDGSTGTVDVLVGMLQDSIGNAVSTSEVGTFNGLEVVYGGQKTSGFTLNVIAKPDLNYPEYPEEGSVDVNKVVADNSQFQNTGVAEIQLSTSGLPIKTGVNVILIMDISNSMSWDDTEYKYNDSVVEDGTNQRLNISKASAKTFAEELLADYEDGSKTDNTLTLLAFAGIDGDYNTHSTAKDNDDVYQLGDLAMSDIDAAEVAIDGMIKATTGGTNYDYAFQQAYAKAQELYDLNGQTVHIVFMTDGVPTHYNGVYYKARNNTDLTACMQYVDPATGETSAYTSTGNDRTGNDIDVTAQQSITVYYNDGTTETKTVTYNKGWSDYVLGNLNGWAEKVKDLEYVAKVYSIGFGMKNGSVTQGATTSMPTLDGVSGGQYYIPSSTTTQLLKNIASTETDYYEADNTEELTRLYESLASEIKQAATEAYYVDQMGSSFNIQMASTVTKFAGTDDETTITLTPSPKIQVSTYKVYTASDVDGETVTTSMIGQRYGNPTIIETVTFNETGTEAYSNIDVDNDGDTDENIIGTDGVIYAANFWYNTSSVAVMIDIDGDGIEDYSLPSETFYWDIGTISSIEYVLSYYVYLDGSADGKAEAGTYATNNYATLYYKNWLGNDAEQSVDSPALAWESASVYYGFYLVDKDGNPVTNRATGTTGSFYDAVKVTSKIFYEEVLLNDVTEVTNISVASISVPTGYTVYDSGATYTITIDSDKKVSGWTIENTVEPDTTYVTDYDGTSATNIINSDKMDQTGVDYTATTVWFAVVWEPSTVPDTVVIDFGLPVDIGVLENDMFGSAGTLIGVGDIDDKPVADANQFVSTENDNFASSFRTIDDEDKDLGFGDVSIISGEVRYTPNSMSMNTYDKFSYEVRYINTNNNEAAEYYYGDVTVIPATTIYYEDSFMTYKVYDLNKNEITSTTDKPWQIVVEDESTDYSNVTQDEDRPGEYSLSWTDANNVYGYDSAYATMSMYSLGAAKKVHVDETQYATAEFDFYGTGFDVISLTSNTTGTITVKVSKVIENEDGSITLEKVKNYAVDTYYGYKYENGEWIVDSTSIDNSLYQIPVMKIADLPYAKYHVCITAVYDVIFDHNQYDVYDENGTLVTNGTGYDLYLDAIRIYDPANTDEECDIATDNNDTTTSTIGDAYIADTEGWPVYYKIRNNVLAASALTGEDVEIAGVAFMDGISETASFSDYAKYGPNNEIYLAPGQAIAFQLDLSDYVDDSGKSIVDTVQIGVKNATSVASTYKIFDAETVSQKEDVDVITAKTLNTSTDMYYDITALKDKTIVIMNTGTSGMLSLTNVKITFVEKPTEVADVFYINGQVSQKLLDGLNKDGVFDDNQEIKAEVSKDSVKEGETITLTVETTNYVEAVGVYVNDSETATIIEHFTQDASGNRCWTLNIDCEDTGTMNICVVGYNKYGAVSQPTECTVTVTELSTTDVVVKTIRSWINSILSWFRS